MLIAFSYYKFLVLKRSLLFFFFNDTATTEIYTLSLHDALLISPWMRASKLRLPESTAQTTRPPSSMARSEEHTSELQSQFHLVCRLLLEKKKKYPTKKPTHYKHNLH